jgi:hypothetical protein
MLFSLSLIIIKEASIEVYYWLGHYKTLEVSVIDSLKNSLAISFFFLALTFLTIAL